jgi:hypothetical protein
MECKSDCKCQDGSPDSTGASVRMEVLTALMCEGQDGNPDSTDVQVSGQEVQTAHRGCKGQDGNPDSADMACKCQDESPDSTVPTSDVAK